MASELFRGVHVGGKSWANDANEQYIRCAGEGVIDGVDVLSYGQLWNADVTAIGIGANLMQTEPTYAWVDIMSNITYAPADVFDAIIAHIAGCNGGSFTPEFNETFNTYEWHAMEDFDNHEYYNFNGCSMFDIPDINIEWGGYWFQLAGRDLVVNDYWSMGVTEDDANGNLDYVSTRPFNKEMCRFLLHRGEDYWRLGQNFFHGYVARFELD
jgi:hypothetical protein